MKGFFRKDRGAWSFRQIPGGRVGLLRTSRSPRSAVFCADFLMKTTLPPPTGGPYRGNSGSEVNVPLQNPCFLVEIPFSRFSISGRARTRRFARFEGRVAGREPRMGQTFKREHERSNVQTSNVGFGRLNAFTLRTTKNVPRERPAGPFKPYECRCVQPRRISTPNPIFEAEIRHNPTGNRHEPAVTGRVPASKSTLGCSPIQTRPNIVLVVSIENGGVLAEI